MAETGVGPDIGEAEKDSLERDTTGGDPLPSHSGGFELDTQGDLDYEELLDGEGAPHLSDGLEDPLEGEEDNDDDLLDGGDISQTANQVSAAYMWV